MRSKNRLNNGFVGINDLGDDFGVLGINKNYIRSDKSTWNRTTNRPSTSPLDYGLTAGFVALVAVWPGLSGAVGTTASTNFMAFSASGNYRVTWNGITNDAVSMTAGMTASNQFLFESVTGPVYAEGYKLATVVGYPNTGSTLASLNFQDRFTSAGLTMNADTSSNIIELRIIGQDVSTLTISHGGSGRIYHRNLEYFEYIGPSRITTMISRFSGCTSLRKHSGPTYTRNCTNFSYMFDGCYALESPGEMLTMSGTNFSSMFSNCVSLESVPLYDTSNGTNMTYMFTGCRSLKKVPQFNLRSCTNMLDMFSTCTALEQVPKFDTRNVATWTSAFNGCTALKSIPQFDLTSATSLSNMLNSCRSLKEVPSLSGPSAQSIPSMFSNCVSLKKVGTLFFPSLTGSSNTDIFNNCFSLKEGPGLSTQFVTNFSGMYTGCTSLITVPEYDCTRNTSFYQMFDGCSSLARIPKLDVSKATSTLSLTDMMRYCHNLKFTGITGAVQSFSVINCNLSAQALDELFRSLGTTTGKTITITNNWGSPNCTRSIATAKNWTVTG